MSSSEGEILNCLLDVSWSLSSDSESVLEESWGLWHRFICGFESWRGTIVCNKEAIVPIFSLICKSIFARVSPGWLRDKPTSAGRTISG